MSQQTGSAGRHRAGVNHFLSSHGPDLVCFHGDDIGGVAVEGEEFHFVGFAIFINVDHRAHVASHKPVPRGAARSGRLDCAL